MRVRTDMPSPPHVSPFLHFEGGGGGVPPLAPVGDWWVSTGAGASIHTLCSSCVSFLFIPKSSTCYKNGKKNILVNHTFPGPTFLHFVGRGGIPPFVPGW